MGCGLVAASHNYMDLHHLEFTTPRLQQCYGDGFQRRTCPFLWLPDLSRYLIQHFSCNYYTTTALSLRSTEISVYVTGEGRHFSSLLFGKVMLRSTVSRPVCLGVRHPCKTYYQIHVSVSCGCVNAGRPL
jgi:hypothetical protein